MSANAKKRQEKGLKKWRAKHNSSATKRLMVAHVLSISILCVISEDVINLRIKVKNVN